jgi:hypothetical protein
MRALLTLATLIALCAPLRAATDDKQLERVRGTVEYQIVAGARPLPIFGRIDLPDESVAITLANSRARLALVDSSIVEIGETTRVRLGAFNAIDLSKPTVVTLQLGAIHFTIRHPVGGRSNYRFVTPTSQIAVRGTEGYLVTGPTGTDFYCVDCGAGDVTVTVGARRYDLVTGEQAIIIGATPATASVDVVARPCANPAAIALSDGKLGAVIPLDQRVDTTGAIGGDPLQDVPVSY